MNFGHLQRFSSKLSCAKEFEFSWVSFAQDSLKCQIKLEKYKRLAFEQEKDPVVRWLSCVIIQNLVTFLKVNIEVKCV